MSKRVAVIFGQFGAAADPANLPRFRFRLTSAGFETIIVQHTDSKKAFDFLHGFGGFCATVGSSLGAMSAIVFAGYLAPQTHHFAGGFQPSDYDPSGHTVNIPLETEERPSLRYRDARHRPCLRAIRDALLLRQPANRRWQGGLT